MIYAIPPACGNVKFMDCYTAVKIEKVFIFPVLLFNFTG